VKRYKTSADRRVWGKKDQQKSECNVRGQRGQKGGTRRAKRAKMWSPFLGRAGKGI